MTLRDEEEAQAEDRDETSAGRRPKAKNALARQQTTRRRREAASSFTPEPWQSRPAPGPERSHLLRRTEAGRRSGNGISPKNLGLEPIAAAYTGADDGSVPVGIAGAGIIAKEETGQAN